MSVSSTPLQQLFDSAGALDQAAITSASDDLLRSAVVQAVDALERMSDLSGLVAQLESDWQTAVSPSSSFDSIIEELQPTPAIAGGLPDTGCRMSSGGTASVMVADASRGQLIEGLGILHANIVRFEKVSKLMIDSASAASRGEYVQSEFDKTDHRQAQDEEDRLATAQASSAEA